MTSESDPEDSKQTKDESAQDAEDDEPDDWDKRIIQTGCAPENLKLTDCYWDKKDWRQCQEEMKIFQDCWKKHGNGQRTDVKNA